MREQAQEAVLTLFLLLFLNIGFSNRSLLPLIDCVGSMLAKFWADLFRVLENIPFWLHRGNKFDWKETPEGHVIMLDVSRLKEEELKIEVENRVPRVSGEGRGEERGSLAPGGDITWQVYMHESEGQNGTMTLSHVTPLP